MNSVTLDPDDLIHLQQMTTRLQMMVYIALVECSEYKIVDLEKVIPKVQKITHYTPETIRDVYRKLELDDHIRKTKGQNHEVGGSRRWTHWYR